MSGLRSDLARRMTSVLGLIVTVSLPALAQRGRGQVACAGPDTAGNWYRTQRESLNDSQHNWSDDTLRTTLLRLAGLDEANALVPQQGWQLTGRSRGASAIGDSSAGRLRALEIAPRGYPFGSKWPTRDVVGAAAARAVRVIVQRDTGLERSALRRMMEAGLGASVPADVAVLEDRVRLRSGRKQLYGIQLLAQAGGAPRPLPIEDSSHVDLRRDAAGLPPLGSAVCAAAKTP